MLQSTCFGTKNETGAESKDDSGSQGQYREQTSIKRAKQIEQIKNKLYCEGVIKSACIFSAESPFDLSPWLKTKRIPYFRD